MWILVLGLCMALWCGCGDGSKGESPPVPVAARAPSESGAAPAKTTAASVAQLNQELAAKMAFASLADIEKLLQQGATAGAKDRYGLPVIFIAARRGDVGIINALLKAGADANSRIGASYNDDGVGYAGTTDGTPMSYAAGAGKIEAMESLRKAGADVNGAGPGGTTALMQASEGGQLEAVRWLRQNASTAGRDHALTISQRFFNPDAKRKEITQLLQGEGASGRR